MKEVTNQYRLITMLSFLFLLLLASPTFALSTANTTSTLNWDTLTIVDSAGSSSGYSWTETPGYTSIQADTRNGSTNYVGDTLRYWAPNNPWGDYSTENTILGTKSTASTTLRTLTTHAIATADGIATKDVGATADLHRTGQMYVKSDTTLTFSIDYKVENSLESNLLNEGSHNFSLISFFIYHPVDDRHPETNTSGFTSPVWDVLSEFRTIESGTFEGTLSFSAGLWGGEHYSLEAHMYSTVGANSPQQATPVPEPATILLLGAGLAGLAFYRRKKNK